MQTPEQGRIEAESDTPELDKAASRDAWIVLLLAGAYPAGWLLHWLVLH